MFLVLAVFYGPMMARRTGRVWPGAEEPSRAERAAVVRSTRRGEDIGDAHLAPAVVTYADGLRQTRERGGWGRWVVPGRQPDDG
ncbi:hypothetical protein ACWGI9_04540 [Streptomyces sp. NPDC054833]